VVLLVCWWINLTTSFHLGFGDLQSLYRIVLERLFHSINRSVVVANLLSRKLEQKEGPALSRWPLNQKPYNVKIWILFLYCNLFSYLLVS
jgi:hypothetical protein